jgi:hypothetical protein
VAWLESSACAPTSTLPPPRTVSPRTIRPSRHTPSSPGPPATVWRPSGPGRGAARGRAGLRAAAAGCRVRRPARGGCGVGLARLDDRARGVHPAAPHQDLTPCCHGSHGAASTAAVRLARPTWAGKSSKTTGAATQAATACSRDVAGGQRVGPGVDAPRKDPTRADADPRGLNGNPAPRRRPTSWPPSPWVSARPRISMPRGVHGSTAARSSTTSATSGWRRASRNFLVAPRSWAPPSTMVSVWGS